jgi:hypothetical protein
MMAQGIPRDIPLIVTKPNHRLTGKVFDWSTDRR